MTDAEKLVEAVAREIWEAQCDHWGQYRDHVPDLVAWDDLTESRRNELRREARAALAVALPMLREVAAETYWTANAYPSAMQHMIRARFYEIAREICNA